LLFILEKNNVSESAYREHIWFHQCQEDINRLYHFERIPGNIPGAYVPTQEQVAKISYHHSSKYLNQNVFCIINCKEDYDHLKLACKPIFSENKHIIRKIKY
jgi:hypothetical protein